LAEVKEGELKLAIQLVEQISNESFKPEQYQDDVRTRVHELIQRKVEGQEIAVGAAEPPRAQVIDLMEALKASLGKKAAAGGTSDAADEDRKPAKRVGPGRAASARSKASKE